MNVKVNYKICILLVVVLFSISTAYASENTTDNDIISVSQVKTYAYPDLYITDSVLESGINDSPLKADLNGGTFSDIQNAINSASPGDTVFLNGQNYSGNKQITISKNIIIDGASNTDSNLVSVLDANSASRIFYSPGNCEITLRNIILENGFISGDGICAFFGSNSNIVLENFTVQNLNITSQKSPNSIYIGYNSSLKASNINYINNTVESNVNLIGAYIYTAQYCNVSISNLNISNNRFSSNNSIMGIIYNYNFNNVEFSDVTFSRNNITYKNEGRGVLAYVDMYSKIKARNFTICNNNASGYDTFWSYNFYGGYGNLTFDSLKFYNNYFRGNRTSCSAIGVTNNIFHFNITNVFIENNTINDTYLSSCSQSGFIALRGDGIIYNCYSCNNYVSKAFGGILRFESQTFDNRIILENSTFINTTLGASDITLNRFNPSDHGGVICVAGEATGAIIRNCMFINNNNSLGGAITPHNHCLIENCSFINNTATKFYGGAISTFYGNLSEMTYENKTITIKDCYFEGNSAPLGGAIQANGDEVHIYNCTFKNNTAVKGGAVFLFGDTIDLHNSTFISNEATDDLSDLYLGLDWKLFDWNVEGGAVYILGSNTQLQNNSFRYNTASGIKEDGLGGAIYVKGNNSTIINSHFDDNFAFGGNGSAIYLYGKNSNVSNDEFFNHTSLCGTVFIIGNYNNVTDSKFEHNLAIKGGGAIYIDGDYSYIADDYFRDNNATIHGGAIHIRGNNIIITSSEFYENNAIPNPHDTEQGLGGAVFISGSDNEIEKSIFDGNTARNGSAIYNRGENLHIDDDSFLENQAFSYALITIATPQKAYHNGSNQVLINMTLVGGDNIINAIHHDGKPESIFFHNVTYETSRGVKTTSDSEIHPVNGAEKSQGGKILYQDSREDYQNITLIVMKLSESSSGILQASAGDIIVDRKLKTGIYGNATFLVDNDLTEGTYSVFAEHPEDRLYKQIDNSTYFEIIPSADLEISKSVSNSTPEYGDEVIWTITVKNNGPSDAKNVTVNDIVPLGLQYLGSIELIDNIYKNASYDVESGIWSIGNLASGKEAVLSIFTKAVLSNTSITNIASVNSSTYDPDDSNNEDNETITVPPLADLEVIKTVDIETPRFGDVITWTITVTNNGPDTAENVVITDIIPEGLTLVESSVKFINNIYNAGNMDCNESITITLKTRVSTTVAVITNTVNATTDTPEKEITNNNDSATIDVGHEADIKVIKTVSNPNPEFGEEIEWTITVINQGPDTAVDVEVHDVIPEGLKYISDDSNGTYDGLIWTVSNLKHNEEAVLTVRTRVNVANTTITNIATANSVTYDPDESNNKDNDTITVEPMSDLEVKKTVDNHSPQFGDEITWTITVTNRCPTTAENVVITDIIPEGLTLVESSVGFVNNEYHAGNLPFGETLIITIKTRVNQRVAVISNTVNATTDTPEKDYSNNNDTSTIDVGHKADLEVIKTVSNPAPKYGEEITWTITVVNHGPNNAVEVIVTDLLPEGLVFISCDGDYNETTGIWTIGTLNNNTSAVLNIKTLVNKSNTTIENVASVTSDTYDSDESNNEDNDNIDVEAAVNVNIQKTVDNHSPKFGEEISWTITVTSYGPDTAKNVIITDVLPEGLIFIDCDADYENNTIKLGDMYNQTAIIHIIAKVNITSAIITNIAVVTSDTPIINGTPGKNDSATIDIGHEADLEIIKSVSNPNPKYGEEITWTITVVNHGPNNAIEVAVSDILPEGLVFISSDGDYDENEGIWTIGTLNNNTSAVLNIKTLVNVSNTTIENVASVTSDTYDPDESNNIDNESVEVKSLAELEISKTASNSTAKIGDEITWTVTIFNHGPDTALSVVLRDILPEGLIYISDDSKGLYNSTTGICHIGDLEYGREFVINIKTRVNITNATLVNIASVNFKNGNLLEANDTVTIDPLVDLELTKTTNAKEFNVRDTVIWTITITNHGPDTATNTYAVDVINGKVLYISSHPSKGKFDVNTGIWLIGNLAPGESAVLTIVAKALVTGEIENSAYTQSDVYDSNPSNNNVSVVVNVTDKSNESSNNNYKADDIVHREILPATGNPVLMILLALFVIVCLRKRKI